MNDLNLKKHLGEAIKFFWKTRAKQAGKQGGRTGVKDKGARSAVTGGAQMRGFVDLVTKILCNAGVESANIYNNKSIELPGWYRAEKQWDLLVVVNGQLIAAIEFKSQIGPSFGNNFNNRTEEALGSASDIWAAYREGAFKPSASPWLGYLMLLENVRGSNTPVSVREPHFKVFKEFRDASYTKRYEILLTKLIRERLYNSSCLLLSNNEGGLKGAFSEPNPELGFEKFIKSLVSRVKQ